MRRAECGSSLISRTMASVDVFGRHLTKSRGGGGGGGVAGPPGIGFRYTSEGDYDMDKKRLCNIGEADSTTDAASLGKVYKIIGEETMSLRAEMTLIQDSLKILQANLESKIRIIETNHNSLHNLVDKSAAYISSLDARQHGSQRSSGGRTP